MRRGSDEDGTGMVAADASVRPVDRRIATALARLHDAVSARPTFGRATSSTSVCEVVDGTRAVVREQTFEIDADLAPALGGDGAAPTPAALVRAALGSCLALGYRIRAAEAGVPLRAVRVTVESHSDIRGVIGAATCEPPGFISLRYHVEIDSPASTDRLADLVERADRLSPVLDMLVRANRAERTVSFAPFDAPIDPVGDPIDAPGGD